MSFFIYPTVTAAKLKPNVNTQLIPTGVTPGSYTSANITVNSKGLITTASNGTSGTTTILLPNNPPPTVPSATGGLFVSDGSGSEITNTIYYRKESNGPIIPILSPPDEVLITSLSDFPAPAAGIITLDPTKVYRIAGTIDIGTNTITSTGNILIRGGMLNIDKIIKNDATPLIFLDNGTPVKIQELVLENLSGPIFDINGLITPISDISLIRILLKDSQSFGTIKNIHNFEINNLTMDTLQDGIILSDINKYITIAKLNIITPGGTFTALTIPALTTIDTMFIKNSNWEINTGQTGININPGITVIDPPVRIDDISFIGTGGTPVTGINVGTPNFEFFQNVGILNSATVGSSSFSLASPVVIPTAAAGLGNFIPFATLPATPIYNLSSTTQRFILSDSNTGELTYTGIRPHNLAVSCFVSISTASGNREIAMAIYVDTGSGYVQCPDSVFYIRATSNPSIILSNCLITANTGDKIRPQIAQIAGGTVDMDVNTVRLEIVSSSI